MPGVAAVPGISKNQRFLRQVPASLHPRHHAAVQAGQDALEAAGMVNRSGWNFAGVRAIDTKLGPLQLLGHLSLPGMVRGAVKKGAPEVVAVVDNYMERAWHGVAGTFYDKFLKGVGVSSGTRESLRKFAVEHTSDDRTSFIDRNAVWKDWTKEESEALGSVYSIMTDRVKNGDPNLSRAARVAQARVQLRNVGLRDVQAAHVPTPTRPHPITGKQFDDVVESFQGDMKRTQDQLVRMGEWDTKVLDEFYFPNQASFSRLKGDPFRRGRKYASRDDFEHSLESLAEQMGYNPADLGFDGMNPGVLSEFDIRDLHLKRLLAHNRTVMRSKANRHFKAMGMRKGDALDRYLSTQFAHLPVRENWLMKVIGGGKFDIPVPKGGMSDAKRKALHKAGHEIVKDPAEMQRLRDGTRPGRRVDPDAIARLPEVIRYKWKGVNWFVKAPLTTMPQNPGYHIRNHVSSTIMARLADGIEVGFSEILQAIPYTNMIKGLDGLLPDPNHVATFIKAAEGDDAALAALSGVMVGNFKAEDVAHKLRAIVGASPSDLMLSMDELLDMRNAKFRSSPYTAAVAAGEKIASHTEDTFRVSAYLSLIRKGVDPTEAHRRVQRTFVDYGRQSAIERGARDVMPFVRFSIGAAAWTEDLARKPRFLTPFARMQASGEREAGGGQLPESLRGTLSIPMGEGSYLSSLGMPQEAAFSLLGGITQGGEGVRKNLLGSMHPAIRLPAEAATNRSFFFGDEFGTYRQAPAWAPGAATQTVPLPDGRSREEWSGNVNAVLGALPTSRVLGMIDTFLTGRKQWYEKLITMTTGARIRKVDAKRALAEAIRSELQDAVDAGQIGVAEHMWLRLGEGDAPPEVLDRLRENLDAYKNAKKR